MKSFLWLISFLRPNSKGPKGVIYLIPFDKIDAPNEFQDRELDGVECPSPNLRVAQGSLNMTRVART